MDYNDRLWEKMLAEQARQELGAEVDQLHNTFQVGLGTDGELRNSNYVRATREELIAGIDAGKGTPPEQLKARLVEQINAMFTNIEETLGWPRVLERYENIYFGIEVRGYNTPEQDELELDLITVSKKKKPFVRGIDVTNPDGPY